DQLAAQWPPLLPGLHRLEFDDGAVTLTLAFGKAHTLLPRLELAADAFFLDGFAPQRNPDMWSEAVMAWLAELGAADATAATWATSGAMRRALTAAGFIVRKCPGFGPKREMTVATLPAAGARARQAVDVARRPGRAVVVGAGLAGAGVARGLADRGWDVHVLDSGARRRLPGDPGHLAAALTPLVDADDSVRARLTRAGALRAAARYGRFTQSVTTAGTVQVAKARLSQRPEALATWDAGIASLGFPAEWVSRVDVAEASRIAGQPVGRGGLHFPAGLLVRPPSLCADLLAHPAIRLTADTVTAVHGAPHGGWRALCHSGDVVEADVVVLAAAGATPGLLAASGL